MNVLHLINGDCSQATLASLADGLAALGRRQEIWLLGDASSRRRAEGVGLTVDRVLAGPAAARPLAAAALWRELCKVHWGVIHAWMLPAVARFAVPMGRPVVTSNTLRDVDGAPLDPAIDARRIDHDRRELIRMAWGVTDEKTKLVAAIGEPGEVDALQAFLAVGLSAEAGRDVRLLISPEARGLDRAWRVGQNADRDRLLVIDEAVDRPWEVLGGCDLVLAMDDGIAGAWGMAAGLAEVESLCAERLRKRELARSAAAVEAKPAAGTETDGENDNENDGGEVSGASHAGELARAVCRLFDDPLLATQRGDAARAEAATRFDPHRWADRLRLVYQNASRA